MSARNLALIGSEMERHGLAALATGITRSASKQSYYTIRWLVDSDLVDEAMCAYAYFRWLDDVVDASGLPRHERLGFVARQRSLMAQFDAGELPPDLRPEEHLLAGLIAHERRGHAGLRSYLTNMMAVMAFDAGRRGRVISRGELNDYTDSLARAVMDGLSYFIGNGYAYPRLPSRYLAVTGAHICHMLRDTIEDARAGYYNIPLEVLEAARISPTDLDMPAYRDWVASRVSLARRCFREGKRYILRLRNVRAILAGLAYCARFERVLALIERDDFRLRPDYQRQRSPWPSPGDRPASPHSTRPARFPVTDVG